jgi:hypothetical protein
MRRSYVQIDGVLYEKGSEPLPERHYVMGDIKPYQSMADGSIIEGRAQHREHLKRHGCVEVGNEVKAHLSYYDRLQKDVAPQQRKELIRAQVDAMSHREFKAAIKKDADRVKWNSNDR